MDYLAIRCAPDSPTWDLTDENGNHLGVMTDFSFANDCIVNEGPMVTVRSVMDFGDDCATFVGATLREALALAGAYLRTAEADLEAQSEAEYYAEVIGPMRAAEALAESYYLDEDPIWN